MTWLWRWLGTHIHPRWYYDMQAVVALHESAIEAERVRFDDGARERERVATPPAAVPPKFPWET